MEPTNDDFDLEPLEDLPPELAALDRELADVRIAERPSFAPELEAELIRVWEEGPLPLRTGLPGPMARRVLVAGIGALLFVGLAVPPARASLVRLLGALQVVQVETETASAIPDGVGAAPEVPSAEPTSSAFHEPDDEDDEAPAEGGTRVEAFEYIAPTFPHVVDRSAEARLIRRHYPPDLQEQGVGGTVRLQLWVDPAGAVDHVQMREGSGIPGLDRAALQAAEELRFVPATRRGESVGTWVEFDLVFEPRAESRTAAPDRAEEADDGVRPAPVPITPPWTGADEPEATRPDRSIPPGAEPGELLAAALGNARAIEALGSLDGLLAGEPPAGVGPTSWRAEAAVALEEAVLRDPENPAPYLALGRIRRKQGLISEALRLFEEGIEGLQRAGGALSAELVAELHYERGRLLEESWGSWRDLGRLSTGALAERSCAGTGAAGLAGETVSPETAIAWNYLCPGELGEAFRGGFEPVPSEADDDVRMTASFRRAVEAVPAHVGANTELLLLLAEEERWTELLDGARRFAWASRGHPNALLLGGLALQRLGRTEEAREEIARATEALDETEVRQLHDLSRLVSRERAEELASMTESERAEARREFWRPLDPILNTEVNEREVEHLARAGFALLRFGGIHTDPGELWLRYGRPARIRALGAGTDLRTEFWDYGQGPDVTFRRPATGSQNLDLTEEGRAYLEDLRRVLPHWYGNQARETFVLPGQLSRFRTRSDEAPLEVEVQAEVPRLLATGAADSLDLGVWILGTDGEQLWRRRDRIPARVQSLDLRAPAGPAASQVVVELYHPGTSQAAALRGPVFRTAASGEDERVSDLLLVEPSRPEARRVSRFDRWVRAISTDEIHVDDRVGALLELYGLEDGVGTYEIRAELQPDGTDRRIPAASRPAGESGFAESWTRVPRAVHGVVSDYLTVDLSGVSPGRYTLHVVVEPSEGIAPLTTRRVVQRR